MAPKIVNPEALTTVARTHEIMVGESGMMLIGSMAFIMAIFYFTNCRSKLISSSAWNMINLAVSIFCGVLWYDGFDKLVTLIFRLEDDDDTNAPPGAGKVASRFLMLTVWWYYLLLVFFMFRNSLLKLKAFGTVGGHILGFAAIYFFGDICLSNWFRDSPWKVLLVILLFKVAFVVLFGSSFLVKQLFVRFSDDEEGLEKWHDQAKDTGTDFASMALAFLIVYFIRFLVLPQSATGAWTAPSIDGELGLSTQRSWILIVLGILTLLLSGAVAVGHNMCPSNAMDFVSSTISTTAAFLLIFGLMWKCGNVGHSEIVGQTAVAVILSIVAGFFVLFVALLKYNKFHIKAMRAINLAMALAVGLSWEKVFDASMDGVSDYMTDASGISSARQSLGIQIFFTFAYLLVVFPAWMMYILPKTDEDIQKAMKKTLSEGPLPARSCCVDYDLYDDYVDEYDEDLE